GLTAGRLRVARRVQAGQRADRVRVGGTAGPPVVLAGLGLVRVPEMVAAQTELDVPAGVGEPVAPRAEGGQVGGEQLRTGAVEAAGRRVPGLVQDAESLRAALPPGGHRTGQLGGAAAGGRGEGGVEGAGGRGEAGTGAGGGEPHRVLPEAEA